MKYANNCSGEWIQVDHKGLVICNNCGKQKQFLIEHEKPIIKNLLKKYVFMLIKELIILEKYWLNFKQKKQLKYLMKYWKILKVK